MLARIIWNRVQKPQASSVKIELHDDVPKEIHSENAIDFDAERLCHPLSCGLNTWKSVANGLSIMDYGISDSKSLTT